ncbi:hypothetical protein K4A83_17775 [Spirulina subsalsa FACHB-351]|uniref:Uncharacterized protein n=1 Tax=Spirulina subsalsa FACHB-351 TaxID=234711 RepID=A0ABT3L9C5_9CYAN|nr:hypothetical protein [Spirulina subsalsa]MCW6038106.1 hypothetical protein [Spirulina subsalsa FACHB-351]
MSVESEINSVVSASSNPVERQRKMNSLDDGRWQRIKILASRLQAIQNVLNAFNEQVHDQPFEHDLERVKQQLQAEFESTLKELLDLINEDLNNNGFS